MLLGYYCYAERQARGRGRESEVEKETAVYSSDSYPAYLFFFVYDGADDLYRQYKELPCTSLLAEILLKALIQQRSSGPLHAIYSDSSSALLSDYFQLCMQIGYTRSYKGTSFGTE